MIRRVTAICLLGLRAPFRSRLVVALMFMLVAACVLLPRGIKGDGTPAGDVRMLLTWTLGISALILGFATLWAGCATLANDIEEGRFVSTAVSPARPFEIWLGRWLGLVILNAALLAVVFVAIIVQMQIRGIDAAHTRVSRKLALNAESIQNEIESVYRDIAATGNLPETMTREQALATLREELMESYTSVNPGARHVWVFDLPKKINADIHAHFDFITSYGLSSGVRGTCLVTLPDSATPLVTAPVQDDDKGFIDFVIPAAVAESSRSARRLVIEFRNNEPDDGGSSVLVHHAKSMRLLLPHGSVYANMLLCGLALLSVFSLLAALGLVCGMTFSFPVAAFAATSIVCMAVIAGDSIFDNAEGGCGHDHAGGAAQHSLLENLIDDFSAHTSRAIRFTTEPFAQTEALDRLGDSILVEPARVAESLAITGLAFPLLFGLLGAAILKRREL